ncbi:hypothetical protein BH24ACT15_BH24ACT15_23930 [soil metagenome]
MIDDALPVALDLADSALAQDVTAHVESVLGWQVVQPSPHLPVRLLLADQVDPGTPTVVVTTQTDPQGWALQLREGAIDVVLWPADAQRLSAAVPPLIVQRPADLIIAVAAASPGAGASTVALALGAHQAWKGDRTVVVTNKAGMALAGIDAEGPAAVTGVAGLSVAASVATATATLAGGQRPDVLIVDRGLGANGHVLVGLPDAALLRTLAGHSANVTVVTCGIGGLRPGELRRVLRGRRHIALERSFRVARAGLHGRVPVALPGRYLAALSDVGVAAA